MFDFSKSTRNDHAYKAITEQLMALGIYRIAEQYRQQIKQLKTDYCKVKDANGTSGNSPSSCLFYEEFHQGFQKLEVAWASLDV
ncbi:unnamed protein product [Caretta caretta]